MITVDMNKKQYSQIYLSELWNETRLLDRNVVNSKLCHSTKSKKEYNQMFEFYNSELKMKQHYSKKQNK